MLKLWRRRMSLFLAYVTVVVILSLTIGTIAQDETTTAWCYRVWIYHVAFTGLFSIWLHLTGARRLSKLYNLVAPTTTPLDALRKFSDTPGLDRVGVQARLIVRTARFLAAMSGLTVFGALMFNIGDLLRSLPVAELGSLVGQLAVGCGLIAINSFFHKSIARAVQNAQLEPQSPPDVLLASSNNDATVREGSERGAVVLP